MTWSEIEKKCKFMSERSHLVEEDFLNLADLCFRFGKEHGRKEAIKNVITYLENPIDHEEVHDND